MTELFITYILPCIFAFVACMAYSLAYNIHGVGILVCAGGAALGWFIYLATAPLFGSDLLQIFVASVVISVYSEIMARVRKYPVTAYQMVALFPLVPGGGVYYSMEHAINGETSLFLSTLLHTLGLAGALAVGVLLVSSGARLLNAGARRRRRH